ncbi:MAG: cache domain-containing protein [Acidobacteriota bacterium]
MRLRILSSLKARLITSFAVAIMIPALITTLVGVRMIQRHVYEQAESKVSSDLESAKEIYQGYLERLKDSLRIHATRMMIYGALDRNDLSNLGPEMERVKSAERLDILTVTDSSGRVFYRTNRPAQRGDDMSREELVHMALFRRESVASTIIFTAVELQKESDALAEQAGMSITPTPHAAPTERTTLADGMLLMAAAPVFTPQNRMVGILYGGVLINRNYEVVDKIRKTVFKEGVYKGREVGTATIFQDDVRISTNVRNADGNRAITTRVSAEVAKEVLERGNTWRGRAFVVNDWYISAYAPILDMQGKTIGMLYVGTLERPFRDSLWRSLLVFLGIALLGVVLVSWVAMKAADRISKPIRAIALASQGLAGGDYSQEIEVTGEDEIAHLASSFNKMVRELSKAHQDLREWAENLERKVDQRTAELRAMQTQLLQAEKLAGIGKLAAGVAHEINNPLTGILTNSSLMLEDTTADDPHREDLQTIVNETLRCRKIVKGLLDFARQTQPHKQSLSLNRVVEDVLALVRNQASFRNAVIKTDLDPSVPSIMADMDQMRQVVLNIVLNAADAIPNNGEIRIRTGVAADLKMVELHIQDNGPGIPDEIKDKLFEPFFTTKKTGTGLGLSIAYGIVERHGGSIQLRSAAGQGTTFSIRLPIQNSQPHA